MSDKREKSIAIWKDTVKLCSDKQFIDQFPQIGPSIVFRNTEGKYLATDVAFKFGPKLFEKLFEKTLVLVENKDVLVLVTELIDNKIGKNVLCLNLASYLHPGGGVKSGCPAQEEELFRRTNYHLSLNLKNIAYPLDLHEGVYTKNVTIFKNPDGTLMECGYTCDMIAVSALDHPDISSGNYSRDDAITMHRKIETIFRIALEKKHDVLVLGALGCGAYGNPPELVSEIFKIYLKKYAGYFDRIYFAVLDSHRDNNFPVFLKLEGHY